MVTIKVDADACVKGKGKDGALSVEVSGSGSAPLSAKISGDRNSPIALAGIKLEPITVIPDLTEAGKSLDFTALIGAFKTLSEGVSVKLEGTGSPIELAPLAIAPLKIEPLKISLAKIPVDLTISVSTPAQEEVFKVQIRGSLGE